MIQFRATGSLAKALVARFFSRYVLKRQPDALLEDAELLPCARLAAPHRDQGLIIRQRGTLGEFFERAANLR